MNRVVRKRHKAVLWLALACTLLAFAFIVGSRLQARFNPLANLVLEDIPRGAADKANLKLAAYNIAHGRGGETDRSNWTGRSRQEVINHLDAIADQIKASNCDLIVLNEVDFDSTWSHRIDAAVHIAQACGFKHVCKQKNVHVGIPFLKYSFGNAILSKYPFSDEAFIRLPPLSKIERLLAGNHDAVSCTAETPLGHIRIVAVHLESRDAATRRRGVKTILDSLDPSPACAALLGDFNSAPSAMAKSPGAATSLSAIDYLLGEGTYHTKRLQGRQDFTFSAKNPEKAIDHIVVSRDLAILEKKTIRSQLSDHFMVTMTIARHSQD